MNEFDLIERIRSRVEAQAARDDVALGIGDDAAVLIPHRGMQLVASTDQLVDGRHFDPRATPQDLGHLAAASNLSDLAAMGAVPRWLLLALTLPEASGEWIDSFLDGFLPLAERFEAGLVGGNLSSGPLNISVTALGEVPTGQFARRSGALAGDRIVVTGWPGDAAAALALDCPREHPLCDRLLRPTPRVECGRKLAGLARGLIDISDGLLADLQHLLDDPDVLGAELWIDRLPVSEILAAAMPDSERRSQVQLTGGGDYELLAVVPDHAEIPDRIDGVPLTTIGRITTTPGLRCLDEAGNDRTPAGRGWDHFGTSEGMTR